MKPIFLKDGSYSTVGDGDGLNLTDLIQDVLTANNVGLCTCSKNDTILKLGTYRKDRKGKGLHINRVIHDVLFECGVLTTPCITKCIPNYILFEGYYVTALNENVQEGLFLNKLIRDTLRECGIQCIYCDEDPGCEVTDDSITVDIFNANWADPTINPGTSYTLNLNDKITDVNCAPLNYAISNEVNCTAVSNGDNTFTYTATAAGTFSFDYTVCCYDTVTCDTATVTGTAI